MTTRTRVQHQNQVHPPTSKQKRVDSNGNDKRKLWLRSGGKDDKTTMLFCDGLTENGCKAVINSINSTLMQLGKRSMSKRFLITQ